MYTLSLLHNSMLLTVLASTSAVIVHNLVLGTQTTLHGLPGHIAVCTFHVHSCMHLSALGNKPQIGDIMWDYGRTVPFMAILNLYCTVNDVGLWFMVWVVVNFQQGIC